MFGCPMHNKFAREKIFDGPETDLGQISRMLQWLQDRVVLQSGGVMKMFQGGPDVGLGVGAKQRGTKFIKQRSDNSDEYRWADMAEQFVAHYRLTPGSVVHIQDVINWMRMNGYSLLKTQEMIAGLAENDIRVFFEKMG